MSALLRIYDGDGAVCQVALDRPGELFDAVSGRRLQGGTRKWQRVMERLTDLQQSGEPTKPSLLARLRGGL